MCNLGDYTPAIFPRDEKCVSHITSSPVNKGLIEHQNTNDCLLWLMLSTCHLSNVGSIFTCPSNRLFSKVLIWLDYIISKYTNMCYSKMQYMLVLEMIKLNLKQGYLRKSHPKMFICTTIFEGEWYLPHRERIKLLSLICERGVRLQK